MLYSLYMTMIERKKILREVKIVNVLKVLALVIVCGFIIWGSMVVV